MAEKFDHSRVRLDQYRNLETTSDKMAFMKMAQDYINYFRSDPSSHQSYWNEELEHATAQEFVRMVDDDLGLELAKMVVRDLI